MGIVFQRASGATGTSITIDIGAAGNNRLVVCFMADESSPGDTFQGTVSVDGKTFTQAAVADNPEGLGNYQEMHTIDEASLGSSNGSLSVSYSGGDTGWGIYVLVFYGVKDDTLVDWEKEDVVTTGGTVSVENVSSNDGSLVVFGAGNGSSGGTSAWTSPLTERIDGPDPSSAVYGVAAGIETTGQTNKTYSVTIGDGTYRSTGIVGVFDEFVESNRRRMML